MSAIEKSHPTCLSPEAYIRIIQSCKSEKGPKFRSSVYPARQQKPKEGKGK